MPDFLLRNIIAIQEIQGKSRLYCIQDARLLIRGHTLRMTAIFRPFLTPSPPSERKMTSLLLYTMTSLLLILTAFGRPPLPPSLRSSLKYPPLAPLLQPPCLKAVIDSERK